MIASSPVIKGKFHDEPLLHRHPSNPILTSKDWPYSINSVFNAGATLLEDGSTLLLCRVEDRRGLSHLCAARSVNGVDGWQIDPKPTLMPNPDLSNTRSSTRHIRVAVPGSPWP
jgi:predicted GH43/DUF377 family glycosyl hydrolase